MDAPRQGVGRHLLAGNRAGEPRGGGVGEGRLEKEVEEAAGEPGGEARPG